MCVFVHMYMSILSDKMYTCMVSLIALSSEYLQLLKYNIAIGSVDSLTSRLMDYYETLLIAMTYRLVLLTFNP